MRRVMDGCLLRVSEDGDTDLSNRLVHALAYRMPRLRETSIHGSAGQIRPADAPHADGSKVENARCAVGG